MPDHKLNDQLCTEDLLSSQKFLMGNYNTAIYESANSDLRKDFVEIHRQEQDAAQKVFNFMNQKGWYKPPAADPKMISEARSKAQQQMGTLGGAAGRLM
ncbi:MAG: spore coat protein [Bacillota bacterium]|nr:spore coat protein [Bacillota bacterium]